MQNSPLLGYNKDEEGASPPEKPEAFLPKNPKRKKEGCHEIQRFLFRILKVRRRHQVWFPFKVGFGPPFLLPRSKNICKSGIIKMKGELTMLVYADDIVRNAIENTPKEYWDKLCASRAGKEPEQAGSYFHGNRASVDQLIRHLTWEHYTHSAVKEPATAFIARCVGGYTNIVHIDSLGESMLRLEDPKNTGKVEAVLESPFGGYRVDHVVLLVGPSQEDSTKNVVWSFFPGDPVSPSQVGRSFDVDPHGQIVTTKLAKMMGIEWVKIRKTQNKLH